jgi:tRNA A37 methylthiotransferase MiaB
VKSERLARLLARIDAQQGAHLGSLVGTVQEVLVTGPSKSGGHMEGRTARS